MQWSEAADSIELAHASGACIELRTYFMTDALEDTTWAQNVTRNCLSALERQKRALHSSFMFVNI
jgi:hypothetical protein